MREIIAHYKKTSCFVYIFFLIGYGALSLRFIWQTRKSIVGDTCDVSVPRDSSVKITPKIHANFASLNSSIAFGDLRLGGCLRRPQNSRGFCGLFWHTRIRGLYLRIYGSSSKLLTQGEFQSGRFWGWSCIMILRKKPKILLSAHTLNRSPHSLRYGRRAPPAASHRTCMGPVLSFLKDCDAQNSKMFRRSTLST